MKHPVYKEITAAELQATRKEQFGKKMKKLSDQIQESELIITSKNMCIVGDKNGDSLLYLKGKDEVHLRTGHEGPVEEQIYSSTLPSTSALEGM